jgi:NAD(P)-dependent dehydrogenase (short-subunit alcohol dehydrogenase family)
MNLAGKIVVITGGAGGIGRELCHEFLTAGARVWALDVDKTSLLKLEEDARKWGKELYPLEADVSNRNSLENALQTIVIAHSGLDVWVNNAGISGLGDFNKMPLERVEAVLRINLLGTIYGTRIALDHMEKFGRGTIVNIASVAGHVTAPYLSTYCASKHGVIGFTRALREELKIKDSNIRLMSVSPGFVDTGMIEKGSLRGFPEWLGFALSKPEEVARDVVRAVERGATEIYPTLNGKMILGVNKFLPAIARRSSRILLSKNIRDLIFFRKQPPGE